MLAGAEYSPWGGAVASALLKVMLGSNWQSTRA